MIISTLTLLNPHSSGIYVFFLLHRQMPTHGQMACRQIKERGSLAAGGLHHVKVRAERKSSRQVQSSSVWEPPSDLFPSAKLSQALFYCQNRINVEMSPMIEIRCSWAECFPWVSESQSWRRKSWVLSRHCSVHPDSAVEFLHTQLNGFMEVLVLEREMQSAQSFSEVACKSRQWMEYSKTEYIVEPSFWHG